MASPSEKAIEVLRANPEMAPKFDEAFGEGASSQYLTQEPAPIPEPVNPGLTEGNPSVTADVAVSTAGGVLDNIENTGDLLTQGADALNIPSHVRLGSDADNGIIDVVTTDELREGQEDPVFGEVGEQDNVIGPSDTIAGNITRGVTNFVTGFVGAGKLLKVGGVLQGASKAQKVGQLITRGGIADFLGFDPQADRLSNLLQDHLELEDPITEFMAADGEDGEIEGRLKNALEGALVGGVVDGAFRALKLLKKARAVAATKGQEAAEKVIEEGIEEVDGALRGTLQGEKEAAAAAGTREEAEVAKQAAKDREDLNFLAMNKDEFLDRIDRGEADLNAPGRAFNYDKMDSPEAVQQTMAEVAAVVSERVNKASKEGTKTLETMHREALQDLGETINVPEAEILERLSQTAQSASEMTKTLIAGKHVVQSMARDIHALNQKIRLGKAAEGDREALEKMLMALGDAQSNLKVVQREAARTTVAGRIRTIDSEQIALAAGDPAALVKLMSWGAKAWRIHNEYWINALLSGPKTHLINITSNAIKMGYQPTERAIGAALQGDIAGSREAFSMYMGLARALKDSTAFAWKSLRYGESFLDPGSTKIDAPTHAIGSKAGGALGWATNAFGTAVRMPTRLLSAEDEFFKQMNFRANLYADAVRKGTEKGLKGNELAAFIESRFAESIDRGGKGIDDASMRYARETTFTTELEAGTRSRWLQQGVVKFPLLRNIMPFVRTPTNILVDVGQRTPGLQFISKRLRDDLKAGGQRRASALGKVTTGVALWGTGLTMAAEGRMTGFGPSNPTERKNLLATGWRPYSFVTTNDEGKKVYTSFARMDPFGMILGLIADTSDIMAQAPDKDVKEIMAAGATALAHNITSKSYLQGVTQVLNAASQPDRFLERFVQQRAGSYVPTGAQQVSGMLGEGDPYLREVTTILEAVRARIPGLSADLPPQRDWITGEPVPYDTLISPFPVIEEKGDIVADTLASLQHGFGKPSRVIGNVEMTPTQYDRFVVLSTNPPGRTSLHDNLERRIKSHPMFQRKEIPAPAADAGLASDDPRVKVIQKIIKAYRDRAKVLLSREFPELEGALKAEREARKAVARGDADSVQRWLDEMQQ